MMFQACLVVVSLAVSVCSAYLSSSLTLKTGHLPMFGFFLSSPGYSLAHYILWVLYLGYFLVLPTIIFYFPESHSSVFAEASVICFWWLWWDPDVEAKAS